MVDFVIITNIRNAKEYFTSLLSIYVFSVLEHILCSPQKKKQNKQTMQSDFTVVSEGKVGNDVQFLVVERSGPWTHCWKEASSELGPGLAANVCV